MIKPTVGRVVWFWPGATVAEIRPEFMTIGAITDEPPQPCAALVA